VRSRKKKNKEKVFAADFIFLFLVGLLAGIVLPSFALWLLG
jgi:hypothetical protein